MEEDLLTHIAKERGAITDKIKQYKNGMVTNMHNQRVDQYNTVWFRCP